jgi:EmrB/QacA subfamily drug resistance transporter
MAAVLLEWSNSRLQDHPLTDGQGASELERRRWRVLVVGSVGVFMGGLDSSIVSVALPVIGAHLRLTYSEGLWVQAAYLLAITVLVIPVGRLADMHGPMRLYTLGALLFGLFSVVAAFSPNGLFLVVARGFQGVGGALLVTTSPATVTTAFPPEERGRALGFNIMFATIGLSLGPPLGGLIATHLGWRWIFLVNVPVVVGILIGGWDLLGAERRDRAVERLRRGIDAQRRRIDYLGAALLGVMLATLFVPLIFSPLWGWANARTIGLLVSAVIVAWLFVYVEGRVEDPVLDLGLFRRNRMFAEANAASLIYFTATYGVGIFTAVFLEVVQGRTAQQAGLVLLIQPIIMTIVAPLAGRLSDRVGSHGLAATGVILVAAASGQLALVSSSAPVWRVYLALGTLGLGMAFFGAPNLSRVMGSVGRSELGVASGVLATMRSGGQGLSIAVLGAIAASKLGPTGGRVILLGKSAGISSAQAFAAGYREAMLVGAGLAVVGALVSIVGGRSSPEGQESSA